MKFSIKDLVLDELTRDLLFMTGKQDAQNGLSKYEGWKELCEDMGYSQNSTTPARNAYEDGWMSVSRKK